MAQVPSTCQSSSTISISQTQVQTPVYENCLLVTRHKLLPSQEADINRICRKISRTDLLPNNTDELKKLTEPYDCVIGVVPLPFQVQLLHWKKSVILFYMESLGVAQSKAEADYY